MTTSSHKILLVNPPMKLEQVYGSFSDFGSISPPTGLCYIAAMLRHHGHDVSILDAEALHLDIRGAARRILDHSPAVVGIACKTLWFENARRLASAIKAARPDITVVAGGNHVTALPEQTLRQTPVLDVVVVGEGEITFLELIEALRDGADLRAIPGLCLRHGSSIQLTAQRPRIRDLDSLPRPAFDLLPELATHYRPPLNAVKCLPAFSIVASRGCPAQCTFCDRGVFGNLTRMHSPEYTAAIIEDLHRHHGIRYLLFDDDNLLLDRRRLASIMDLLRQKKIRMPFSCQGRVDTVDAKTLALLKRGGCRQIMYGIESGSPAMLAAMRKGTSLDQIRAAVRLTREHGIEAQGFFILGHPGETEDSLKETVALIRGLSLNDVGVFFFAPLPGSESYRLLTRQGFRFDQWERTNSMDEIVPIPGGLSPQILRHYSNLCYNACYLRAGNLLTLHHKLPTWDHARAVGRSVLKMVFGRGLQAAHQE